MSEPQPGQKSPWTKSIALATLLLLLLSGIVFQHYITNLPELEQPITLRSASATAEHGTVSAAFVDKDGKVFHFGVRREPGVDPASFPAFYIRNPELVPYVHWPSLGGPDERALLRLVEGWLERNVEPEMMAQLDQMPEQSSAEPEQKVATVYEIYSILRARHRR